MFKKIPDLWCGTSPQQPTDSPPQLLLYDLEVPAPNRAPWVQVFFGSLDPLKHHKSLEYDGVSIGNYKWVDISMLCSLQLTPKRWFLGANSYGGHWFNGGLIANPKQETMKTWRDYVKRDRERPYDRTPQKKVHNSPAQKVCRESARVQHIESARETVEACTSKSRKPRTTQPATVPRSNPCSKHLETRRVRQVLALISDIEGGEEVKRHVQTRSVKWDAIRSASGMI